jgi:hypothetical protein
MKKYSQFLVFILLFSILQISIVSAAGIGDVFENMGRTFVSIVHNTYFMFLLTFIFIFMILYTVFAAGISKVGAFSAGDTPNKLGKIVAVCLGLLSALGIAYWVNYSPAKFVSNILSWAGVYGAAMLGFGVFGVTFLNWKREDGKNNTFAAACATGFALITYGILLDDKGPAATSLKSIGIFILFCCLVFWLIKLVSGGGSKDDSDNSRDSRDPNNRDPTDRNDNDKRRKDKKEEIKPNPVNNVRTEILENGDVRVSWDPNPVDDGVTHYGVIRLNSRGGESGPNYVNSHGNYWIDEDDTLENNVEYTYRVFAYNVNNTGDNRHSEFTDVKFTRRTRNITGRIVYNPSNNEEDREGISNINLIYRKIRSGNSLTVKGSQTNHVFPTHENGRFVLEGIICDTGLYDLVIEDPTNVYNTLDLRNIIIDSQGHTNNEHLEEIYLEPRNDSNKTFIINFVNNTNLDISVRLLSSDPDFTPITQNFNSESRYSNIGDLNAGHFYRIILLSPANVRLNPDWATQRHYVRDNNPRTIQINIENQ